MNSLVKVFSNFKEFYNEINGATLTGAIDVIVVEQPDGTFLCSPFHVRFGKLGVLRSREKIVDIEVNGEPVDIHMKLGESGEAFFVEECPEDDLEQLPANMATSPLPTNEFSKYEATNYSNSTTVEDTIQLPLPRRNSIDFSKESEEVGKKFENQVSDFSHRRHTDNTLERRDLSSAKMEFTTQKIRQEWAVHEEQLFGGDGTEDWQNSTMNKSTEEGEATAKPIINTPLNEIQTKEDETSSVAPEAPDSKSKKKRRKKSMMKKKQTQRKSSSSSSVGSVPGDPNENDTDTTSVSNNTISSTNEESLKSETAVSASIEVPKELEKPTPIPSRVRDLDIHFFSDTDIGSGKSPHGSRPSTPIQSDSEIEISQRDKGEKGNLMTSSASWKWGELPTQGDDANITSEDATQAQRNSMLSNMFSFMKQSKKMRKTSSEGVYLSELDTEGMDPEMAALYFPPINKADPAMNVMPVPEDDGESGNGTSLPHSPSSVEEPKSLDSDYEDGKSNDNKYLDFVSMSMCGGLDQGGPTDEEFDRNVVQYSEVCQNPSIFSSPLLVVRLNGKYYSWTAACPIVMTIITYQKPLTNDAIEQLMNVNKQPENTPASETKRGGYSSWWYWRRSAGEKQESKDKDFEGKDGEMNAVGTQTSRATSPEDRNRADFDVNPHNVTGQSDLSELNKSQSIEDSKPFETFRKSLRLTTEQIESLNLKSGMNEISFSVTTAYQGTSRCKCYLFRWKHNDKVVISDIDGTITKSDVLGHILPMVGRDWAQIGVAQLFSKIEENGYKLLYLSARAIGQSKATREYLRSIRQGNVKLPDGPLLLNPTSLISALHREVIEKKPEQFKIACLSDIQALFQTNPFYAGYGNKINDVWAYRAVGIPIMRIFTINPKGELKHELTQTFQSTYCNMTYIVDQLFPPINDIEESVEFSNFNYWREPVPDLAIEIDLPNSTPLPVATENQKV